VKHKITPRQLEALLASYFGQRIVNRPTGVRGVSGELWWTSQTNMGGAVRRMADDLRERGYVTTYNHYEDFGDKKSDELTTKGYAALEERLDKLPIIKNVYGEPIKRIEINRDELRERANQRALREAEIENKRFIKRQAKREIAERRAAADRAKLLARFRQLLKDYGIADNWDDEQVLRFAEQAGDALHSY
jgi:hypothetical protein